MNVKFFFSFSLLLSTAVSATQLSFNLQYRSTRSGLSVDHSSVIEVVPGKEVTVSPSENMKVQFDIISEDENQACVRAQLFENDALVSAPEVVMAWDNPAEVTLSDASENMFNLKVVVTKKQEVAQVVATEAAATDVVTQEVAVQKLD